ncbi:MAG: hypothetical protein WCL00_03945, partial [Bacteroidota bacterium]
MKRKIIMNLLLIIAGVNFSWATVPTLSFRMTNPRIIYTTNSTSFADGDNLEFDVEIKADQLTYYYQLQIVVAFPTAALGDFCFTAGAFAPGAKYENTTNMVGTNAFLGLTSKFATTSINTAQFTQITTTWGTLGTLRFQITDPTAVAGIQFYQPFMDGISEEKLFASPWTRAYNSPSTYVGPDMQNLYLGRIYSSTYGWSQVGGSTLNVQYTSWPTAVNTSVWNIGASPAEIANTGSQALGLRIHNGAQLKIDVAKDLTCTGATEINGGEGLYIASDPTGTGSFIDNGKITYPNSGTAKVERYMTACATSGGNSYACWHYVSSPIQNATANVFLGNYLKYYDEPSGSWSINMTYPTMPLTVERGYSAEIQTDQTKSFVGPLNTNVGAQSLHRTYTPTPCGYGYNLMGNPYPSAVNMFTVLDPAGSNVTNIENKVWYLDKAAGSYKVYQTTGGGDGSQYAPAMQGFFVKVKELGGTNTDGSLTIPNSARVHHSAAYYKSTEELSNLLYLKITNDLNTLNDVASVVFRSEASQGYDEL